MSDVQKIQHSGLRLSDKYSRRLNRVLRIFGTRPHPSAVFSVGGLFMLFCSDRLSVQCFRIIAQCAMMCFKYLMNVLM